MTCECCRYFEDCSDRYGNMSYFDAIFDEFTERHVERVCGRFRREEVDA